MLNIDPVVQVNVSVGASSAAAGVFDVGAILGPSSVLNATSRFGEYASLSEMATAGFANTTPEYLAAAKYFGVSPAPAKVIVIFYDTYADAEAYSSSKTYDVGDRCTYDTKLYRCISAITVAEAWNAEHWSEITSPDTPTSALLDAVDKGAQFYAVYYCPKSGETAANIKTNILAIDSALNSLNRGAQFYGFTGTPAEVIDDGSLLKSMSGTGSKRSFGMYCTTEINDAAGLMGVAMGYSRTHQNNAFALCYKSIASATPNNLTESQVTAIKNLNGNVYIARTLTRSAVENGAAASGFRFDEVLYVDMIAYDLQTGIYSMIADSDAKLPQNDSTSSLFLSEINRILERYYNANVLATGIWRGADVGNVTTGATVDHGYSAFVASFDEQSAADRALHKAMPVTIVLLLSGSVESIVLNLDIQT